MDKLTAALNGNIVNKEGTSVSVGDLFSGEKVVMLYFSAHWCPPCRGFTPQLAEWYEKMKKEGKQFEVIFVSSDRDEASFKEYFGEMPWTALKYDCRDQKTALSEAYSVRGIPTLVVLKSDGSTITTEGRAKVTGEPNGFPWC